MQPLNQGSRWPTSGVASARYTRGSIEDGPGVSISRLGGASSPIDCLSMCCVMRSSSDPELSAIPFATGPCPQAALIEDSAKRGAESNFPPFRNSRATDRSEEHTSELQSHLNLVCRLL